MKTTVDLPMLAQPSMKALDRATLFRICSWADEGEIERAGEKAARLLQEGVYDYQLVALWLAYRFERDGITDLVEVLSAAVQQLLQDLDRAAPADEAVEARNLDRTLAWFANNVAQRIHFHSKMRDAVWTGWLGSTTAELMDAVGAQLERAIEELEGRLERIASPTSPGELRKLDRRVRSAFGAIVEEVSQQRSERLSDHAASGRTGSGPAGSGPAVEAATSLGEPQPTSSGRVARAGESAFDLGGSAGTVADPVASRGSPAGGAQGAMVGPAQTRVGSERMCVLRRKLEGFEELARRGALREAAIVARDVERELGQFDPLLYLPEIFEGYLSTLLRHGSELEEHMVEGHGLEERALERLYQADPVTFLQRACEDPSE